LVQDVDRLSVRVNKVTSHAVSDDGAEVILVLDARHVGELALMMSAEGLGDLIAALNRCQSEIQSQGRKQPDKPSDKPSEKPPGKKSEKPSGEQVEISVPKTWVVGSDLKTHELVLVIFNHQTESQAGYALGADAAKQMATALVKNADAVLTQKARRADAKTEKPGRA
jgi:hypothetical protein